MIRWPFALLLCCLLSGCATAYEAAPQRSTNLAGRWVLNESASDDAEKMLLEKLERERAAYRRQMERWRRADAASGQPKLPPMGEEGAEVPAATRAARERVQRRREREEDLFRRMLGITPTLRITQEGGRIEITSAVETRRFEAGSHTQVSMHEGHVADSRVGWDGEWFTVSRRARGGPSVIEKFRLIRKNDQLEYIMSWSGETELAGMKIRRVFDRATEEEPVRDPAYGPVR